MVQLKQKKEWGGRAAFYQLAILFVFISKKLDAV
jgi:hypothetical protein